MNLFIIHSFIVEAGQAAILHGAEINTSSAIVVWRRGLRELAAEVDVGRVDGQDVRGRVCASASRLGM